MDNIELRDGRLVEFCQPHPDATIPVTGESGVGTAATEVRLPDGSIETTITYPDGRTQKTTVDLGHTGTPEVCTETLARTGSLYTGAEAILGLGCIAAGVAIMRLRNTLAR